MFDDDFSKFELPGKKTPVEIFDEFFESINFSYKLLKPFKKIFVNVSGGLDSTLLVYYIHEHYPDNTWLVNSWNPFENNKTLQELRRKFKKFITVRNKAGLGKYIKQSFLNLNIAAELVENKTYHKKIFPCCNHIKHKAYYSDSRFKKNGCVIIDGQRRGEGKQRRIWLTQLENGLIIKKKKKDDFIYTTDLNQKCSLLKFKENTFFHLFVTGFLKCYPFRDYITIIHF